MLEKVLESQLTDAFHAESHLLHGVDVMVLLISYNS